MSRSYLFVYSKRLGWLLMVIVLCLLVLAPFLTSFYIFLHIIDLVILILVASSFNIVYGYLGQLPFGFSAYSGLAAYIFVIFAVLYKYPMMISALISIGVTVLYVLGTAAVLARLKGIYFSILSLGLGQIVATYFWSMKEFGGDVGIHFILIHMRHMPYYYLYIVLPTVLISLYIIYRILNSPFGLAIQCIQDNEERARSIGIPTYHYKLMTMIIAGLFAGIAGILYAGYSGVVHPRFASWEFLTVPLVGTLLGGPRTFFGPIIGTAIYGTVYWWVSTNYIYHMYITGALIVVLVAFFRKGLIPFIEEKLRPR